MMDLREKIARAICGNWVVGDDRPWQQWAEEADAVIEVLDQRQLVGQPIETAPKNTFLLLGGPSGYTTVPFVWTTGRMCSDYKAGRWVDHANDDLLDWGFKPTHWMPLPEQPK